MGTWGIHFGVQHKIVADEWNYLFANSVYKQNKTHPLVALVKPLTLAVLDSGNDSVIIAENSKSSGLGASLMKVISTQDTTNSSYNLYDGHAPSGRWLVRDSGNVQNTNNSYGSISDERVKQNITDANSQWDDIKALKIRNFKLKSDSELYKL